MDGAGRAWLCALEGKLQGCAAGRLVEPFPALPNPRLELTVAVALCKGERFEHTIEKLAELGVARFIPLLTEHTERREPSASKFERWKQISRSASALAYRLYPMVVERPVGLADLVKAQNEHLLFFHPGGEEASKVLAQERRSLTLAIGPEGGFSISEVSLLIEKATMVGLGAFNLRVETAAVLASGLALRLSPAKEISEQVST